jgi:hypothetical protein
VSDLPAVPDYYGQFMAPLQRQQALGIEQQNSDLQKQQVAFQIAEAAQKLQRQQQFQQAAARVVNNPSPEGFRSLFLQFPEQHEGLKPAWDQYSEAEKQRDLKAASDIYSSLQNGRTDLALSLLKDRQAAFQSAGHDDKVTDDAVTALESGDPAKIKQIQGMAGMMLATATGPDKIGPMLEALGGKGGESYTLAPGDIRYDSAGNVVAQSPFIKGPDGTMYERDGSAAPASGSPPAPASVSASASSVASTLASAGMPAPVVAGFLGNFHVEGGYTGAKGDGGSASGIAQWHNDRAKNFEKVIGKSVTDASPEEQARFVAWEMQNPKAAGMTVAQRDAIMNAKTPAQAAALIDQHYERSSGKDRKARMAAANAFAGDVGGAAQAAPAAGNAPPGYHVLLPGGPKNLPSGYEADPAKPGALRPIPGGPADQEAQDALDPATKTFYAQQIIAGAPMPTLGMGKSATKARQDIMKEVARLAGTEGLSGADQAIQMSHYKAATQALKTLETQAGTVQQNEETALLNGQQFIDRSKELSGQTSFPVLNSVTQSYLRHTGDPTIAAMDSAWQTFTTEYAKVVAGSPSGSGTLSDSARHEAQTTMRGNYSYEQKVAALKQMQTDMSNRMTAIHNTIANKYDQLTKNPRSAAQIAAQTDLGRLSAPKSANSSKSPPPGATKTATGPHGEKAALVNGHWVRY